jgi:DNA-directed RNA polymerase sigma subunit (sigma70/sigma32)
MRKINARKQSFKTQFRFKIAKVFLFLKSVEVIDSKQINVLFAQIKSEDDAVIKKLQQGKLTLDSVVAINCKYQSHFFDFKFIKTGNEALLKSASRFGIPLTTKKISLIEWWIRQEILAEV